ncbi:hypothetical protein FRACYDRAFT_243804 [Fragilariopsis cylindrus CCMP1102]|uniref:Uncharacterized protein n=1 Tax=Fragilariopsis cylindrus CCMP1102 TaxID=635003 RepID=A0A1E7F2Z8_9STRA|nr:hypothetical protein FRACYDRAFT_243804 [Fragilariopsis cylindrus CCMP1102]|eukprot:OEU12552.1 hypothetical protein FRACYDRAFT_243804 [Fragilariopsis cylindrus CCMP1102]
MTSKVVVVDNDRNSPVENENSRGRRAAAAMTRSYPNFLIILIICILCSITIYSESNHLLEYVSVSSTGDGDGGGGTTITNSASSTITIKEISTTTTKSTTKSILTATTTLKASSLSCKDKIGTFKVKGINISGNKKLTCQKVKKKKKCHQKGNNGKQLSELCPIQCQTTFCGEDHNSKNIPITDDNDNDTDNTARSRDHTSSSEDEDESSNNTNVANTINSSGHDGDDVLPIIIKKKNKKKKKFIVIHIGPSKTGTTSIQKDSSNTNPDFQTALEQDQVVYVGKFADRSKRGPFMDSFRCMKIQFANNITYTSSIVDNGNDNDNETIVKRQQQRQHMIDTCWSKNKYILELSIVDSTEGYSYKGGTEFTNKIKDFYTVFIDYLDYDEIIIVGAYRRYYDWLPSTYKEGMKNYCLSYNLYQTSDNKDSTRKKTCKSIWKYIAGYIDNKSRNGKGIQQLFSTDHYHNLHETLPLARDVLKELVSAKTTNSTTMSSTRSSSSSSTTKNNNNSSSRSSTTYRVELLNYFQLTPNTNYYNSITTELYCQILGNDYTPNVCQYSKNAKAIVSHQGSLDNVPYKLIIYEAQKRNWITGFPKDYKRVSQFLNTTTIIKQQGNIGSNHNYNNIDTWEDLQNYHKNIIINSTTITGSNNHKTTNNSKLGQSVLPLVCPPKKELEKFLKQSLAFEKLILPNSFIEDIILGEQKHILDFWKLANNGAFCSIDIKTLFGHAKTWEQFLKERMIITNW